MQKMTKYVIFHTKWGYFGLAGTESSLCQTCLAGFKRAQIEARLLGNDSDLQFEVGYFKPLQEQIQAYYEGESVNFDPQIPVLLNDFRAFSESVLTQCRQLKFGQTISYVDLAKKSGRPAASRAVGGALARNPMPLIIPCHRVLRTDGSLGGFTAPGGITVKKKMLELEQQALASGKISIQVR